MSDFIVDLTPKPIGAVVLQVPSADGGLVDHRYLIMALDKARLAAVTELVDATKVEEADPEYVAEAIHKALGALLEPENGGPPAGEFLKELWDSQRMPMYQLQNLGAYVAEKATTGPPA